MQLHIFKQEGAEGHHRVLRKGKSHIIKPLCTQPLLWDPHHLHLKKLRPRAGKGLIKSHTYLPCSQHPQLALLLACRLHTWGREGGKN